MWFVVTLTLSVSIFDWFDAAARLSNCFLTLELFNFLFLSPFALLSVSIGGSFGLFVGASLLSFIEIFYYFTIRAGLLSYINAFKKITKLPDVFARLRMRGATQRTFNQHNE